MSKLIDKIYPNKDHRLPIDCQGLIFEYLSTINDFRNIICLSKEVNYYLKNENPACLRNIKFNLYLDDDFIYMSPILFVFSVKVSGSKKNWKVRYKILLFKVFPNLECIYDHLKYSVVSKKRTMTPHLCTQNFSNFCERLRVLELSTISLYNTHMKIWRKLKNLESLSLCGVSRDFHTIPDYCLHRREIFQYLVKLKKLQLRMLGFQSYVNHLKKREMNPLQVKYLTSLEVLDISLSVRISYTRSTNEIIDRFMEEIRTLKELNLCCLHENSYLGKGRYGGRLMGLNFPINGDNLVVLKLVNIRFVKKILFSTFFKLRELTISNVVRNSNDLNFDGIGCVFFNSTIRKEISKIPKLRVLKIFFTMSFTFKEEEIPCVKENYLYYGIAGNYHHFSLLNGNYLNSIKKLEVVFDSNLEENLKSEFKVNFLFDDLFIIDLKNLKKINVGSNVKLVVVSLEHTSEEKFENPPKKLNFIRCRGTSGCMPGKILENEKKDLFRRTKNRNGW